jgi:molybdopterin/thiamine biosynthesis adenylyltransferase
LSSTRQANHHCVHHVGNSAGDPPNRVFERHRTADGRQACGHHAQALAIARQLGTPPEQARALEGIGHSHLRDGHASEATASLEQALAIYQRIGSPAARRVQETLLQLRQDNLAPER